MMRRMKWLWPAVAIVALLGACQTTPDRSKAEKGIQDWTLPPPGYEHSVSGAIDYEDLSAYSDSMIKSGWEISDILPAGPEFPARYIIVCRKNR